MRQAELSQAQPSPIEWMLANMEFEQSDPVATLYDKMESQSGECLPVIYKPFDGRQRMHFVDRGQILDFAATAGRDGGRVLDFGPGDGWPSLLLAPMVDEVVGVEGSKKRVEVCTRNAERLGLDNVQLIHVQPGERLPFDDSSFDGVAAAASVEQTADPRVTLQELHRVLKPGGRLRMYYESLSRYSGGKEQDIWLSGFDGMALLLVYDRDIDGGMVNQYALFFDCPSAEVEAVFSRAGLKPSFDALTPGILTELRGRCRAATTWTTRHPSCPTLIKWMTEIGFDQAQPTHHGGAFAGGLFDRLAESERHPDVEPVDRVLKPLVEVVVNMEAPDSCPLGKSEPWITACK